MSNEELVHQDLVIQNQKLTTVTGLITNLLEIEAAALPEIFRAYQFPVTEKQRCIDVSVAPSMPWISFQIVNDRPDDIYCFVNEIRDIKENVVMNDTLHNIAPMKYAPVLVGETMKYSMGFSGIVRVYLQCNVGDSSDVRIFSEGKRPVPTTEV